MVVDTCHSAVLPVLPDPLCLLMLSSPLQAAHDEKIRLSTGYVNVVCVKTLPTLAADMPNERAPLDLMHDGCLLQNYFKQVRQQKTPSTINKLIWPSRRSRLDITVVSHFCLSQHLRHPQTVNTVNGKLHGARMRSERKEGFGRKKQRELTNLGGFVACRERVIAAGETKSTRSFARLQRVSASV
eukprot:866225-Pleurochrysis_carterae.AAC.5